MREQPYKSKGRPTVCSLAKHKSEMALKDKEINTLTADVAELNGDILHLKIGMDKLMAERDALSSANMELRGEKMRMDCRIKRSELIIDKLIGY